MRLAWSDIEVFLAIAERGSLSRAARTLALTQPTVSRRLAALEDRLGFPLFRRDVEGAHLTQEGQRLLPSAQQMARWAREIDQEASGVPHQLEGVVRIASAPGLAHEVLVPFARRLRERVPSLRIELLAGLEHIDLSRGDADLALRSRRPSQPDLMVVFRASTALGVFASADYAERLRARKAPPWSPADIDWVTWSAPNEHIRPRPELEAMIPNFVPAFASNDYVIQLRAVAHGLGAMILERAKNPDSTLGELVELPLGLPLPQGEFFLVCAKSMRRVPRVARAIDELVARFGEVEALELDELA
ncbi:MAG TPA: LysR family transcriptional regulator [Polyangiaceae bacterium]|nr:LysR family transcriptional regulator [Polyangiaceae bacterium]